LSSPTLLPYTTLFRSTLGEMFHALGHNVLIARFPHHGLKDRLTTDQVHLTAEELVGLVDEVMDIARGLGDHITLVGLSGGGVMTDRKSTRLNSSHGSI